MPCFGAFNSGQMLMPKKMQKFCVVANDGGIQNKFSNYSLAQINKSKLLLDS